MKKLLSLCLFVLLGFSAISQKYAIIDTRYILDKMPEYGAAEKRIEQVSQQWQKEIDEKQTQLDRMYKNFEAEKFIRPIF